VIFSSNNHFVSVEDYRGEFKEYVALEGKSFVVEDDMKRNKGNSNRSRKIIKARKSKTKRVSEIIDDSQRACYTSNSKNKNNLNKNKGIINLANQRQSKMGGKNTIMSNSLSKSKQKSNQEPKNMVASSYDEENSVFKLDTKFFGKAKDPTPVESDGKEMKDKKNSGIRTPIIPLIDKYRPIHISKISIGSGFDRLLEIKKLPVAEDQEQKQNEGVTYPELSEEAPDMILPEQIMELMK
jgi:hypothetical protein